MLADALLKQSLNRGISVVMKQQLPRPCVQTVAHGANGIADISCVHAVHGLTVLVQSKKKGNHNTKVGTLETNTFTRTAAVLPPATRVALVSE